jgi:hypothetical protein
MGSWISALMPATSEAAVNTWLRRIRAAALVLGCSTVLLAACAEQQQEEATVPATAPLPGRGSFHVFVERGQNLNRIAQLYHVAKPDIIAANQLKPPYTLKPGTILEIPFAAVQSVKPSTTGSAVSATGNRATSGARSAKANRREVIDLDDVLDDVPTHSLPMPKPELPGIRSN